LTIDERDKVDFWITDYKNVVFQRCLFLGFSKSSEIRNLLKKDRSRHQDVAFELSQYKRIDSLVQPIIKQAKIDSINFYHQYLIGNDSIEIEEQNGLPMMKLCLAYYESNELQEIAEENVLLMPHLWK
jgi:hypothetical protein